MINMPFHGYPFGYAERLTHALDFVNVALTTPRAPWENRPMQEDGALREIRRLVTARDAVERSIADAIRDARDRGVTWEEVGKAMGFTNRQAAYQWFKRYEKLKGSK
jgi:hypothetical protein